MLLLWGGGCRFRVPFFFFLYGFRKDRVMDVTRCDFRVRRADAKEI